MYILGLISYITIQNCNAKIVGNKLCSLSYIHPIMF